MGEKLFLSGRGCFFCESNPKIVKNLLQVLLFAGIKVPTGFLLEYSQKVDGDSRRIQIARKFSVGRILQIPKMHACLAIKALDKENKIYGFRKVRLLLRRFFIATFLLLFFPGANPALALGIKGAAIGNP